MNTLLVEILDTSIKLKHNETDQVFCSNVSCFYLIKYKISILYTLYFIIKCII